ncbi:MAG: hypothetical protein AB1758_30765 [Candidatus Eremiobacterota bacterium]
MMSRREFLASMGVMLAATGCNGADPAQLATAGAPSQNPIFGRVIDVHGHLHGTPQEFAGSIEAAVQQMTALGVATAILMPPPQPAGAGNNYDADELLTAITASSSPGRFRFMAGGGTLNVMVQQAIAAGYLTSQQNGAFTALRDSFQAQAESIRARGAVGFGELACEHFSFNPGHPYVSAPPDHPLFLLLAEVAARLGVPLDIHMEAVPGPEPFVVPPRLQGGNTPPTVPPNIPQFETLLRHNGAAHNVIWDHLGFDNTNFRTPELTRQLMSSHANLYVSMDVLQGHQSQNLILDNGVVKPEWVDVMRMFPNRFLLGADQFFRAPGAAGGQDTPDSFSGTLSILQSLPEDLALQVAFGNAQALLRL